MLTAPQKFLTLVLCLAVMSACGRIEGTANAPKTTDSPPVGVTGPDDVVVMGRASFTVSTDQNSSNQVAWKKLPLNLMNLFLSNAVAANPGTQTVTVVLAGSTTLTLSTTNFSVPAMSNSILDFGHLDISALSTNDLKKCGTNSNQKCGKALVRIYTSGAAGAGFWNSTDGYGAPMSTTGPEGTGVVGLNQSDAKVVQIFTIPNSRNTVALADFSPTPNYNISGDFRDAGSGSYSTTINVEFALSP